MKVTGGASVGLVKTVDRFCEGVVIAVADASHGGLDASFCQTLGVPNGHVLGTTIRVMNEAAAMSGTPIMKRLLQSIEDETRVCCSARPCHFTPIVDIAPLVTLSDFVGLGVTGKASNQREIGFKLCENV